MFLGTQPIERLVRDTLKAPGANVQGTITIVQATHGFSRDDVVYNNAGTWTLAQADSESTLGTDFVTLVVDANTFEISSYGYVTSPSHGLGTAGQALYLSDTTPGLATTTDASAPNISQMIGEVVTADIYRVHFWAAQAAS